MRNNDFDFIKNKFDAAMPDVPDSLDEGVLRYQILTKQEHRLIKFEQKKKINITPIISAAACFILVIGVLFAVNPFADNENKATHFKSYEELNSVVEGLEKWGNAEGLGGGSSLFQDIYTPDDLKNSGRNVVTNGKNIFCSYYDSRNSTDRNKLYIFSAQGENSKLVKIMDDVAPSDDYEISDLFLADNSLTVTVSNNPETIIKTYDMSDPEKPVLINELKQDGMLTNSYVMDDIVYLVSFYGVAQDEVEGFVPKSENLSVKAKNIYRFDDIRTANYMVIGAVDVKTGERADETRAILGCCYESYITNGNLYVVSDSVYYANDIQNSDYIKYDLKSGKAFIEAPEKVNLPSFIELAEGALMDVNETLIRLDDNKLFAVTSRVDWKSMEDLGGQEIILYDITDPSAPAELDRLVLEESQFCTDIRVDENGVYTFSTYFADEERRYDGAAAFEIRNDKIVLVGEYETCDSPHNYFYGNIVIGDYVYSFDKDDTAPDGQKLTMYSNKMN